MEFSVRFFSARRVVQSILLLTLVLAGVSIGYPTSPVQYFVRPDGSDTLCTGTTYAAASATPNCAFATPAFAVGTVVSGQRVAAFSCANGDDVAIDAGTYTGAVTFPSHCRGTLGDRVVFSGAGEGNTIIVAPAGAVYAISLNGGGNAATAAKYITLSNFSVAPGYQNGITAGINSAAQELIIDTVSSANLSQLTLRSVDTTAHPNPPAFIAVEFYGDCANSPYDHNVFENITVTGDPTTCMPNTQNPAYACECGSRANAYFLNTCGAIIHGGRITDLVGQIGRLVGWGTIDGLYAENISGDLDDGAIQDYNTDNIFVRNFTCKSCSPGTDGYAVLRQRRSHVVPADTGSIVIDSTFKSTTVVCPSPPQTSTVCGNNVTCRNVSLEQQAYGSVFDGPGPYDMFKAVNNIFVGYKNGSRGGNAIYVDSAGSPSSCPTTLLVDGNIFFQNTDSINVHSCTGTVQVETQIDPGLDSNLLPSSPASNACTVTASSFTEPYGAFCWQDSDCPTALDTCTNNFCSTAATLNNWVGANRGQCSCGNGTVDAGEACDPNNGSPAYDCTNFSGCNGSGGTLICLSDCSAWDVRQCVNCGGTPWQCRDNTKNGSETATDCGGPYCQKCATGQACLIDSDCASSVCSNSVCAGGGRGHGKQYVPPT